MYAVICNAEYYKYIEDVIKTKGEEILISSIGNDRNINTEMDKIGRISIRHLIIDISSIEDEKYLITAIRRYRIMHDKTQIIIIAPNCLPGNNTISVLVSMGIYDIIAPSDDETNITADILHALDEPATYKKAVRWVIDEVDNDENNSKTKGNKLDVLNFKEKNKENEIQRTVTITKEKIIGTVVISVAGSMHRIGTTHAALSIAKFLRNNNFKVAVIEVNDSNTFNAILKSYDDVKDKGIYYTLADLDFFPYNDSLSLSDIYQYDYNYIVLDLGLYTECDMTEFKRSNVKIIVNGVKDWEIKSLESILRTGDYINKAKYYFNFADKESFKMVESNMDRLNCYQACYNPNPFTITKDTSNLFKELLREVIPETKQSNKKCLGDILGILKK